MLLTAVLNALNTMSTGMLFVLSIASFLALIAIGNHHHANTERRIARVTSGYYMNAPTTFDSQITWIDDDKTTTATFPDPCGLEAIECQGE